MPTDREIEAAAEAIIAFLPGAPWDTLLRPYGLARVALEAGGVSRPFDPVGAQEIAERVGVQRDTVWKWRRRYPDFPKSVTLNMGPVWNWAAVMEWIERNRPVRHPVMMLEKGGAT
jgi:predicted DNA-binding transcriptional regulator AlpA